MTAKSGTTLTRKNQIPGSLHGFRSEQASFQWLWQLQCGWWRHALYCIGKRRAKKASCCRQCAETCLSTKEFNRFIKALSLACFLRRTVWSRCTVTKTSTFCSVLVQARRWPGTISWFPLWQAVSPNASRHSHWCLLMSSDSDCKWKSTLLSRSRNLGFSVRLTQEVL